MQPDTPSAATAAALRTCMADCANAADGRGRRWPRGRCVEQLQLAGASPWMASRCADAAVAVGVTIAASARAALQALNTGAAR
jgi:hypothetical protein